jgi:hypothetical protein
LKTNGYVYRKVRKRYTPMENEFLKFIWPEDLTDNWLIAYFV